MHDLTVLLLPGAYASSVALTLDMLRAAVSVAPQVDVPVPRWRVLAVGGNPVRLGGGMSLEAKALPRTLRAGLPPTASTRQRGTGTST